jgi:cell division protein FtsW (lipid II flippase)
MNPRNRELVNLVLAAAVGGAAFASAWIVRANAVSTDWLPYAGALAGAYLVTHLVVRRIAPLADASLLPAAGLLTAIGLTTIYRLDPDAAKKQVAWVGIGLVVFIAVLWLLRFDYRILERYKYVFGVTAIVLLLLPSLPKLGPISGVRVNGVKLWLEVGPIRFQPGEFAKVFLIVFLAGYLRDKRESLARGRPKDLGPLLVIWGAAMLVLVQTSDLGPALLSFGIFLAMVYVATGRVLYVAVGTVMFVGGAAALYNALSRVRTRVTVWLHPWTDSPVYCPTNGRMEYRQDCESYQLVKSLYSIANGNFGGTGIGKGTFTNLDGHPLIPLLNTDFIYSAIAQEIGLVGACGVLLVVIVMAIRGMRVSLVAQDGFSKLLAAGLTFGLALQTFIIVGGVLRVVPLTGITLPFVSYGGSSILSNFAALALLLLVSHRASQQGRATAGRAT